MGVWQFIQDQVLGMKWLNELIGKGLSLWQGIKERRSERANPESKRVKSKSVAGECGCISPLFVV